MAVTINMLAEHFGDAVVCRPPKGNRRFLWPALIASLTLPKRSIAEGIDRESAAGSTDRTNSEDPSSANDTSNAGNAADESSSNAGNAADIGDDSHTALTDEEALYFGNERSAAEFLATRPEAYALAVGDGRFLNEMSPSVQSRLLLVDGVGSFAEVFERVRMYMLRYNKWVGSMKQALLDGGGYQALLDCSKDVFDDFISITDSSFRLMASTGNPPADDKVAQYLVKNGYHSPETIQLFRKYQAIRRWRTQTGIVRVERTLVVNDPTLSYVFRMHGDYFVHMVLQSKHGLPSAALIDMFQMLIDHVSLYVRHDWLRHHRYSNDAISFLRDLVTRHSISEGRLRAQLEQNNMQFESNFRLAALETSENEDETQPLLGYCAWRLSEIVPFAKVFIEGKRLLLLDDSRDNDSESNTIEWEQRLDSFRQEFGFAVGVSDRFYRIDELPYAFKQARLALEYGKRARPALQEKARYCPRKSDIHYFGDYLLTFVMEDGAHDTAFVDFCLKHGILWPIYREDCEKNTQDLDLLYCYLACERRANAAAEIFHMHRNTLVYRMERLQKRFGFDLDNPATRERLLTELNMLYARETRTATALQ